MWIASFVLAATCSKLLVTPSRTVFFWCKDQSIALTLKTDGKITVHGGNVHLVDQMLLRRASLCCLFFEGVKRILALVSWRYRFPCFFAFISFRSRAWVAQGLCRSFLVYSAPHISIYRSLHHNFFAISSLMSASISPLSFLGKETCASFRKRRGAS